MNLVGDIVEVTSDQLTSSYVHELKQSLKTKHEETLILQKTNSKLTQKIIELQEKLKLIESQRDFEILKSNLLLASQNKGSSSSSNPNDIVQIVSSWFPSHVDASVACCIKAEDSWIVVEEKLECQRIPLSSLLDEVVLCCALSDDGFSGTELIPESILRSLGWSPLHKSVAITAYSGCVWVIIGINFQDLHLLIPGLNSLLHISTELIIGRVMNLLQETETSHHLSRVECSLEIWKLLLQPTCELSSRQHYSPPLTSRRKKRDRRDNLDSDAHHSLPSEVVSLESAMSTVENSLSLEIPIRTVEPENTSLCEHIFQTISKRIEKSIEGMECEILLFCEQPSLPHQDPVAWIISSTRGVSRRDMDVMPFSLTEKAIFDQEELYVREITDPNNSSLNHWIDCGGAREMTDEIPSLAISPIWKDITFRSPDGINIHGALVYRINLRRFTESELSLLRCISKDNVPIIKQWIENNLQTILKLNQIPTHISVTSEVLPTIPDLMAGSELPAVSSVPTPEQVLSEFSNSLQQLACGLQLQGHASSDNSLISSSVEEQSQRRLQQVMGSLLEISLKLLSSHFLSKGWVAQDAGVYLRSRQGSDELMTRGELSREKNLDQPQFLDSPRKLPDRWNSDSLHGHSHSSHLQNLRLVSSEEFQQIHSRRRDCSQEENVPPISVLEIFIYDRQAIPIPSPPSPLAATTNATAPAGSSSVIASILISFEHSADQPQPSQQVDLPVALLLELNSLAFLTESHFTNEQTVLDSLVTPLTQHFHEQLSSQMETVRALSRNVLQDTMDSFQNLLPFPEAKRQNSITPHLESSRQPSIEVISQEWKSYREAITQVSSPIHSTLPLLISHPSSACFLPKKFTNVRDHLRHQSDQVWSLVSSPQLNPLQSAAYQEEIAYLKDSQQKKIQRSSQLILEKIQDRLLLSSSSMSSPFQTLIGSHDSNDGSLSEDLLLDKIHQLSLLANYNSVFLQSVIGPAPLPLPLLSAPHFFPSLPQIMFAPKVSVAI
jgi:hypothetical protein